MAEHAKEPWSTETPCPGECCWHIFDRNGDRLTHPELSGEDARRIVACVNALEGLNDDALAGGWSFRGIEKYAKGLECQRDALLQELRTIANADTVEWDDPAEFEAWAKNRARAAIEKVEGLK
jgi:hypothetical protein